MLRLAGALAVVFVGTLVTPRADAATGRHPLPHIGLWVQFDNRANSFAGYWQGELIQRWTEFDSTLGHTVADEAALQLDKMKAMGITHITYELRTADASTAIDHCSSTGIFPTCTVCNVLGLDWPIPPKTQLDNLRALFDLADSKKIKIDLLLTTTHMEEIPRTNSGKWIGAILNAVKTSPALDLVLFGGDRHTIDSNGDGSRDTCGGQGGEPPLWLGVKSYTGDYLKWVIPFAIARGVPVNKLSAEAIVGDYFVDSQPPAGPDAQDSHLWKPIGTLKGVFDALNVPVAKRTYAASFYEHTKCSTARNLTCSGDLNPHAWAENRMQDALAVIGQKNAKRLLITEGASAFPQDWPNEHAVESLGYLMNKYSTGGANFWRWTAFMSSEETDPAAGNAVKKRGMDFTYLPPKNEIVDLGGFHLTAIPNGSFELGATMPTGWTISGNGTARRYHLAGEANEPQVPSRGAFDLRLKTGGSIRATSNPIAVDPNRTYTTTGNLRFNWSGDPNPFGDPATRPQVFVAVSYYQANGQPSATKPSDTFRYFQEDGAADFRTFPIQYRTPADAATLRLTIGVARNGLPTAITLDADNLR